MHDIAEAARRARRDPEAIKLIAVSKTVPEHSIEEAIACGQRRFGENRVQEAKAKLACVASDEIPDSSLHLIGPLQTNKVSDAVAAVRRHRIPSTGRSSPRRLPRRRPRADKRPRPFVQVNTGEEQQRAGVLPAARPPPLSPSAASDRSFRSPA